MVRHRGTVVAFVMDSDRHIVYAVLDLNNSSITSSTDVDFWPERPRELQFTNEIAEVGFGILDQTQLPLVKKGGQRFEIAVEADNGFGRARRTFTTAVHTAPVIDAGLDQKLSPAPIAAAKTHLEGGIKDNGMPPGSDPPVIKWTQVSGPAQAIFDDASQLQTGVTFPLLGKYEFELSVSNGRHTVTDRVTMTVALAAAGA